MKEALQTECFLLLNFNFGALFEQCFHSCSVLNEVKCIYIDHNQGDVKGEVQAVIDIQDVRLNISAGHEIHGVSLGF